MCELAVSSVIKSWKINLSCIADCPDNVVITILLNKIPMHPRYWLFIAVSTIDDSLSKQVGPCLRYRAGVVACVTAWAARAGGLGKLGSPRQVYDDRLLVKSTSQPDHQADLPSQ